MKNVVYMVKLLEPGLPGSLGGDPNASVAFDYIPGGVVRGAVISVRKRLGGAAFDAGDETARRMFFDGSTRFLNAYPVLSPDDGSCQNCCLPVPRSWHQEKGAVVSSSAECRGELPGIHDAAVSPLRDSTEWKPVRTPFFACAEPGTVWLSEPSRRLSIHTMRDRRYGRSMSGIEPGTGRKLEGAVYRYDALEAGQMFRGAIVCDCDADADSIASLLSPGTTLSLGKSRTGGYGLAEIISAQVVEMWHEALHIARDEHRGGSEGDSQVTLTLMSDAILRDAAGQYVTSAEGLATYLTEHLSPGRPVECKEAFFSTTVTGGFSRKWGLPLPQDLALAMGSVFVMRGLTPDAVVKLESGIGERQAEGFGRVAVNLFSAARISAKRFSSENELPECNIDKTDPAWDVALLMARRIRDQRLDSRIVSYVNSEIVSSAQSQPFQRATNSQIGRLRLIVHKCMGLEPAEGRQELNAYLESVTKRSSTKEQYDGATLDWLKRQLDANEKAGELPSVTVGGVSAPSDDKERYLCSLRLIDAVLARAAKNAGRGG